MKSEYYGTRRCVNAQQLFHVNQNKTVHTSVLCINLYVKTTNSSDCRELVSNYVQLVLFAKKLQQEQEEEKNTDKVIRSHENTRHYFKKLMQFKS